MGERIKQTILHYRMFFALLVAICLYSGASFIASYLSEPLDRTVHILRDVAFIIVIVAWGAYRARNLMSRSARRYFALMVVLMVYWLIVRAAKFYVIQSVDAGRALWYLYYIPICFLPALGVVCTASLAKAGGWRSGRLQVVLLVAAGTLALLVLTNDVHQLAFRFPEPIPWSDAVYLYGPLRPIILIFAGGCMLAIAYFVFAGSHVPESRKIVCLPLVVVALGVAYTVAYPLIAWLDMTIVYCSLIALEWESLISSGLIHANRDYDTLFQVSSLSAAVTDGEGAIVYASENAPSEAIVKAALESDGTFEVESGVIVHREAITDGYFIWLEDASTELDIRRQIEERSHELVDEQELMRHQIALREEQAITDTRNQLYGRAATEMADEFSRLALLMDNRNLDTGRRVEILKMACIVGAYIKRRSNLIIMGEWDKTVSAEELLWCMRESCDCLRLGGVPCGVSLSGDATLPLRHVECAYDFFQMVAQRMYPTLSALLACIEPCEAGLRLRLQLEMPLGPDSGFIAGKMDHAPLLVWGDAAAYRAIDDLGGGVDSFYDEGVWNIDLFIPAEGSLP